MDQFIGVATGNEPRGGAVFGTAKAEIRTRRDEWHSESHRFDSRSVVAGSRIDPRCKTRHRLGIRHAAVLDPLDVAADSGESEKCVASQPASLFSRQTRYAGRRRITVPRMFEPAPVHRLADFAHDFGWFHRKEGLSPRNPRGGRGCGAEPRTPCPSQ